MIAKQFANRLVLFLVSAAVLSSVSPGVLAAPAAGDSKEVTGLLSQVRTEAVQLRRDTEEMRTFSRSTLVKWESHVNQISQIKENINAAGRLITRLHQARASASPWQQQAIDHATSLLRELADNTSRVIDHLSKHPDRIHAPVYRDYVAANAELATDLSGLISDYVEYGKVKNRTEMLEQKLEPSGN